MPLPRSLAKVNKRITNRIMIRLAARPPFAALHHVGRSSGRDYRIPINVFPTHDGFVFALTYGPESDWVKNVLAAGGAELEYGGERIGLTSPRFVGAAAARTAVPGGVRLFLRLLRVSHFLEMSRV